MTSWHYNNPVKICFGAGVINELAGFSGTRKSVLVTTPGFTERGITDSVKKQLGNSLLHIYDGVRPNPTFKTVNKAFDEIRSFPYEQIVALGGGSVIDTAKAIAAIGVLKKSDWIEEHLKNELPFPEKFDPKPIIALPTTAGTGSEVTMWATIWDMDEKKKYSISHPLLYPNQAILDPELTGALPENETIYGGLDALSHAMESIWNKNHNSVSDMFALGAISLANEFLPMLKNDMSNLDLRAKLFQASLFAGLAFSNTKTALAHSISYPLTANFGLPHGLAAALPLPHLLKFNGNRAFDRIAIMSKALRAASDVDSMSAALDLLFESIGIKSSLIGYGVEKSNIELIAGAAAMCGRSGNNIAELSKDDIIDLVGLLF